MSNYRKNLLEQLRVVPVSMDDHALTDKELAKAMTVNEELKAVGYTLNPADIIRLARSNDLDTFYVEFSSLLSNVNAKPMYPDFPTQVMKMDEAEFRFHQLRHYFSTYGTEYLASLFGLDYKVTRGWLPEVEETEKVRTDITLLRTRTFQLIPVEEQYSYPFNTLIRLNERLTKQEVEIIKEAAGHLDLSETDFDIPFKENMMPIFYALFLKRDAESIRRLCQHTGDILKCLDYTLTRCDYHFRTSEKNFLVKLIESYPASDFKSNLILSNKKARRNITLLEFLSYNRHSASEEHKEAVRMLRNGELSSWEGQVKAMLANGNEDVLEFIAKRPGMLLRWTNWLIKIGQDKEKITEYLLENAEDLSTRTLAFTATLLGRKEDRDDAYEVIETVLKKKLSLLKTDFKGKKVYVDPGRLDLKHSLLLSKGDEAGYIRNGLAYSIPEYVRYVRFFVYWYDDDNRVDIDLHATALTDKGEQIDIGWNSEYYDWGIVFSGDVTHSDAAEYIDIDMETTIATEAQFNVNLYDGYDTFDQIEKCFIGMMAVSSIDAEVLLYDSKECFFQNDIRTRTKTLNYGYLNVKDRFLCLDGSPAKFQWVDGAYTIPDHALSKMNLESYIDLLLEVQGAEKVETAEEAEVTMVMEKPESDDQISLIDQNFYL